MVFVILVAYIVVERVTIVLHIFRQRGVTGELMAFEHNHFSCKPQYDAKVYGPEQPK